MWNSYTDESGGDSDSEFEKLMEQYRTPLSKPVGKSQKEASESEDEETEFRNFSAKLIERFHSSLIINKQDSKSVASPDFPEKQKLTFSSNGDSENNSVSADGTEQFHTPSSKPITEYQSKTSESEDDETALRPLAERIMKSIPDSYIETVPSLHNTEHISSDSGEHHDGKDTSSDSEKHHDRKDTSSGLRCVSSVITSSDSEDEEIKFLKFSERIRQTPQLGVRQKCKQNAVLVRKTVTNDSSDDDEVFLKLSENVRKPYTPRSQNRKQGSYSSNEGSSNLISSDAKPVKCSLEAVQARNKEEFTALFPGTSETSVAFCRKRVKYAEQLFCFFNRKIFDSQLSKDIPLIWDNSLAKAAGLTTCSRKNNVYTCSIKLSSKLLTSFDRLQDTLLHEMCHAAVWLINNIESVNHGPLWQIWGSRCKMILPFIDCPERCHTYDVPYSIWYQCFSCKWKKGRFRESQRLANSVCKKCGKPVIITRTSVLKK